LYGVFADHGGTANLAHYPFLQEFYLTRCNKPLTYTVFYPVNQFTMYKLSFAVIMAAVVMASCGKPDSGVGEVDGFVPVYQSAASAKNIAYSGVRAIQNPGKIVALGNTLFQVETGKGVHVINMANPASPSKTGFIEIPGCQEMSIKGNYVYANNFADLVVLDISNTAQPNVVKRVDGAFPDALNNFPPERNVYFECPDPAKGIIAGWVRAKITNPGCRR
jgi:LVIVD repeat